MYRFSCCVFSIRYSGLVSRRALCLLFSVAMASCLAHAGTIYYVSTTGNDTYNGTSSATPWKTIQHAADTLAAGDTVYVEGGTYSGPVNIHTHSGTAAEPITFAAYSGETPIITGTDVPCCTEPTNNGSGIEGLINVYNVNYVTVSGFTTENYTTNNNNYAPAGIYVIGPGTGIKILYNTVTNITTSVESNGGAYAIVLWNTSATPLTQVTISGNKAYANKTGFSETVSLNGNVTHFTITNNIVHNNDNIGIVATGNYGVGPAGHNQSIYGEISGNTVYENSSIKNPAYSGSYGADGIYCDGCAYVVIERNRVYGNDINIEAASEVGGGVASYVTIRNNIVYDAPYAGISIGGYGNCTKVGDLLGCGKSENVVIVNNTLYNNGVDGGAELNIQYRADNTNIIENNIVYAGSDSWVDSQYSTSTPTLNYNLYYAAAGYSGSAIWKGVTESSFAKYQSASTEDAQSKVANPDYISMKTPNFDISSQSPAIDAGSTELTCSNHYCGNSTSVYGAYDYAGNARINSNGKINIGAYEK